MELAKYRKYINTYKTETMLICPENQEINLEIEGIKIQEVEKLKYPGSVTEKDGRIKIEITNKITMTNRVYHGTFEIFHYYERKINNDNQNQNI